MAGKNSHMEQDNNGIAIDWAKIAKNAVWYRLGCTIPKKHIYIVSFTYVLGSIKAMVGISDDETDGAYYEVVISQLENDSIRVDVNTYILDDHWTKNFDNFGLEELD